MEWLSFHQVLIYIQHTISLIGVLIILSGVILSLLQYLRSIFTTEVFMGDEINQIRSNLGKVLILGLEFIVAADLISTTTTPDYYSVGILASIVAIRTILSYTLSREINILPKEA